MCIKAVEETEYCCFGRNCSSMEEEFMSFVPSDLVCCRA